MVQELARGANAALPTTLVTLSVACASPVDVSALLLGADGRVRSDDDLVFYNAPRGPGVVWLAAEQAPRGTGAVTVDTAGLPPDVERVVVTASLDGSGATTFGAAGPTAVTVLDATGDDALQFPLTGLTTERAVVCAEVYRRAGAWRLRAVGQGWDSGLAGIAAEFGVQVDDPGPAPPGAAAPPAAPVPPVSSATPVPPVAPVSTARPAAVLAPGTSTSLGRPDAPPPRAVEAVLAWSGQDAPDAALVVVVFDGDGRAVETVRTGSGGGGALTVTTASGAGSAALDLAAVPAGVRAVVLAVVRTGGRGGLPAVSGRLVDGDGPELARLDLAAVDAPGLLVATLVLVGPARWQATALGRPVDARSDRALVRAARAAL